MGYYKQKQVSDQERVDDIIRWWKSHENQPVPQYLLETVVNDPQFFAKVLNEWEHRVDNVMGGKRMTRKQSERLLREQKRRLFWSMSWEESRFVTIALFTSMTIIIGLLVYIGAML